MEKSKSLMSMESVFRETFCIEKNERPFISIVPLIAPGGAAARSRGKGWIIETQEQFQYTWPCYSYSQPDTDVENYTGPRLSVSYHGLYDIVLISENPQNPFLMKFLRWTNVIQPMQFGSTEQMTQENASSLVLKVKAELQGFPELELTVIRTGRQNSG